MRAGELDVPVRTLPAAEPGMVPAEPLWMLRVNPMRRSRIADPVLADVVSRLASAEHEIRSAAERCSVELYEQIGATADEEERGRLIAMRRAIHNGREPRAAASPATAPAAQSAVADWLAVRELRRELREQLAQTYQRAIDRERIELAARLGDEDLRRALALVAPEVYDAAERYRAAASAEVPMPARVRKSERGLIQYVTRAMIRTSPLSRFTAVGVAVPDEGGIGLDEVRFETAAAFPGLDRVMLGYVLGGLREPGHVPGQSSWVQLPPTSDMDAAGGRYFFLQPAGGGIRRLSTPVTPTIRLLLEATAMGPRPVDAVAEYVAARSGRSVEGSVKAVLEAVRAGILCECDGAEDGAADIADCLARPGDAGSEPLQQISGLLPGLAGAEPAERAHDLVRIRSSLAELSQAARRPAQILVEEDYILSPATVDTSPWRRQLDDLAATVELLSVFDRLHDVRALLSAAFVERFGAGADVPLHEHATFFVDEVYRRGGAVDGVVPSGVGPADGSLDGLQALRREVMDWIHPAIAAGRGQGTDVVWSAEDIVDLVAGLPDRFRQDPVAYGVLVQPWREQLIFNDAYAGHGMLYGRFLGADRRLGGRGLAHLAARLVRQYGADGCRVVEDPGLHRLNVNAHPRILADEDQLTPADWFTLRLVHDPGADTVKVRDAQGRDLRVLTLGAGHPELFPAPLRLASWLVSGGRLLSDLSGSQHGASGWDEKRTVSFPRLSVGSTVLSRRRWYGGAELAAALSTGPAEHARLAALTSWRSLHAVPEEIVLKTPLDDGYRRDAADSGVDAQAHRRRQKPQYADLASALTMSVLPRLMERRSAGYLEEALPAVADGAYASEWVVEIGRTAGGPFQYGGKI